MSEKVREVVGEPPDGYVLYWQNKFPTLMMYTYEVVRDCGLRDEKAFHRKYFTSSW